MDEYFNKERYQCIGSEMFKDIFENKTYDDIIFLHDEFYMNYIWTDIHELFVDFSKNIKNLNNTVGFHWFNGSDEVKCHLKEIKINFPEKFKGILFEERNKILQL